MPQKSKSESVPTDRLKATLTLDESATIVKGISAARLKQFEKFGVKTVRDLLMHFPRRYVDLSQMNTASGAQIGDTCTVTGTIVEINQKRPRRNLNIIEVAVSDDTGIIMATIFNKPWLMNKLSIGERIAISGKVEFNYGFKRMNSPIMEILGDKQAEGKVLAVYPATEKLTNPYIRNFIANALLITLGMYDILPDDLKEQRDLISRQDAFSCIHEPASMDEVASAKKRLVYDELLMLELYLMINSMKRSEGKTPASHVIDGAHLTKLDASVPFTLTEDQQHAVNDLLQVMQQRKAANHMILGDVGTGKTIVAAFGIASAKDSGGQALLLAPTEVLAQQHYKTLGDILGAIDVGVALLTGSTPKEERDAIIQNVASGEVDLLIGTHAILEADVLPKNMTLAIIDEQQRFGVSQRSALISKGTCPDALYLTATPIPRTMALAMFGNLSLSYIKQRPNELAKRVTKVVRKGDINIAYDGIKRALDSGHQAYVVCPLIGLDAQARDALSNRSDDDESEGVNVSIEDLSKFDSENVTAAMAEAKFLQEHVFPDRNIALLYGSMKPAEKKKTMQDFKQGDIDILVSTTVIEVGIDVGNATVMVIEDADRFGLSQLHQLRGRVGRDRFDSEVYLVSASSKEVALSRLKALESCDDGFELAKYDLSMRHEGDLLGSRQSGISALKIADIFQDEELLVQAHDDARAILSKDPHLALPPFKALAREMRIMFDGIETVDGG